MAVDRGAYIDQSQSLNIHIAEPNYGKLTSMHFFAWKSVSFVNFKLKSLTFVGHWYSTCKSTISCMKTDDFILEGLQAQIFLIVLDFV